MTNSQSYYIPGIIRVPESWRGVVSQVAEVYGIPPEQIMAKDRKEQAWKQFERVGLGDA